MLLLVQAKHGVWNIGTCTCSVPVSDYARSVGLTSLIDLEAVLCLMVWGSVHASCIIRGRLTTTMGKLGRQRICDRSFRPPKRGIATV